MDFGGRCLGNLSNSSIMWLSLNRDGSHYGHLLKTVGQSDLKMAFEKESDCSWICLQSEHSLK